MSKISKFFQLLLVTVLLAGCAVPGEIPSNYLRNPRELSTMANGCWIIINQSVDFSDANKGKTSGELIAVQNNTFYILTQSSLVRVPTAEIITATMYLFKNQTNYYLLVTGLGLLPNVIGAIVYGIPAFLTLGIPFAIVGITTASIECKANELRFPKMNKLDEFGKFSRFPQGIPPGVELEKLTLISNNIPDIRY